MRHYHAMKNVFFTILLIMFPAFSALSNEPSVMAAGDWFRITVDRDGVYRITYAELVNLGLSDPANVRIYGLGGGMLPDLADKDYPSDLQEIPIFMQMANQREFRSGDYILFYAQGPAVWKYNKENQTFEHSIHLWDNQASYFITSKAGGKRITTETPPATTATHTVTTFDERQFYEKELISLQRSGRHWYGEEFGRVTTYTFPFAVHDIETGASAWLNISFMAQTTSNTAQLSVRCNGQQIANQTLPANRHNSIATEIAFDTAPFNPMQDSLSVELTISGGAGGFLDYIRLFARRRLNMRSSQLFFRDTQSVGEGNTAAFQITGGSPTRHVWDITDIHNVRRMNTSFSNGVISFSAATDQLREFVAFDVALNQLLRPNFPSRNSRISNQNLRSIENVDMIIVTHSDFLAAAHDLAALHSDRDAMVVKVVTAQQIYNEFSSGMKDPAAIRNFMKHVYDKSSSIKLKYLLLMGAGTFDSREIWVREGNYIITYQSENSWHITDSYVSDDYFGILGNGETPETGKLLIGVGRLPVQTADQAKDAVNKTRRYMDATQSGDWQNYIGLLAQDGDDSLHAKDTEKLAKYIDENHPQYTVEKLYSDAFPRVATADGHRYPAVEHQLNNLLNNGCLLVNYIGHGNTSGLSEERIVNVTGIEQWRNRLYPIFVAATCQFGRYDGDFVSGGEVMLLSPHGGSIAVLAGTRLVYSSLNFDINENFINELLTHSTTDDHRLGDIVRRAKNASISGPNRLNFAFLGNPALKPAIPSANVQTVTINGIHVYEPLDPLKANSRVTVTGVITDADGNKSDDFNGVVHFTLFDKPVDRKTLNNSGNSPPVPYRTQTSTLHKGKASVHGGEFELSFVMPNNINYQYGFGKISYFAGSDDGKTFAAGTFREVIVGGSVPGTGSTEGPKIQLFMNDAHFRDGGVTDQNPLLIARLQSATGINTSNEGIGHQITATLSHDPSKVYTLNRYYETDLDSYSSGVVQYRFTNLPEGAYELWFTASDLENNRSQQSIRFNVTNSSQLQIKNLNNYPNPFTDNTRIYFEFNMPDTEIELELQIFDISGRLLRSIRQSLVSEGFTSGEFEWDRRDAGGNRLNAGIYPYRVILRTEKGQVVQESSRMVVGD